MRAIKQTKCWKEAYHETNSRFFFLQNKRDKGGERDFNGIKKNKHDS